MGGEKRSDRCIEWRSILDNATYFSVEEYEDGFRWAERLSSPKARAFHNVSWTEGAPRVEELRTDWQETSRGRFRICDWTVYEVQMRKLIGID
jgi:hypothetical protein